jgi:hypothetical protein
LWLTERNPSSKYADVLCLAFALLIGGFFSMGGGGKCFSPVFSPRIARDQTAAFAGMEVVHGWLMVMMAMSCGVHGSMVQNI